MYCGRGGSWRAGRPRPAGAAGPLAPAEPLPGGEMIEAVDMDVYLPGMRGVAPQITRYQLKKLKLSADFFFSTACASCGSPGETMPLLKLPNCAAISELFDSASGTPELNDEEGVGGIQCAERARVDRVARVDDHVVVRPAEHAEQLLDGTGVGRGRTIGLLGPGQNLEFGFVLGDELPEEVAVQPMQIVDGVEDREPRAHAQEQRDLAETGLQVEDEGRALRLPAQLHGRVHRYRRGPCTALGAKVDERLRGLGSSGVRGLPPRRRAPDRRMERLVRNRPHEELVRARTHRLQN